MPKYTHDNIGEAIRTKFVTGVVATIDTANDMAAVDVSGHGYTPALPLFYHCDPNVALRGVGSLVGAAAAFSVGDQVVVMAKARGFGGYVPECVVGFADGNLRECGGSNIKRYVVILCKPHLGSEHRVIVWDLTSNKPATFWDGLAAAPTEMIFASGAKPAGSVLTYNDWLDWSKQQPNKTYPTTSNIFEVIESGDYDWKPDEHETSGACSYLMEIDDASDPSPYSGLTLTWKQQESHSVTKVTNPYDNRVANTYKEDYIDKQVETGIYLRTCNASPYDLKWYTQYEVYQKEYLITERAYAGKNDHEHHIWNDTGLIDYQNKRDVTGVVIPIIFDGVVPDSFKPYEFEQLINEEYSRPETTKMDFSYTYYFLPGCEDFFGSTKFFHGSLVFGRPPPDYGYLGITDCWRFGWNQTDIDTIGTPYWGSNPIPGGPDPYFATTPDGTTWNPIVFDEPGGVLTWDDKVKHLGSFVDDAIWSAIIVKDIPGKPTTVYANSASGGGVGNLDFMNIPRRTQLEDMLLSLVGSMVGDYYFQSHIMDVEFNYPVPS